MNEFRIENYDGKPTPNVTRIRNRIRALGIKRIEVARRADVASSSISDLMSAKHSPTRRTLFKLKRALDDLEKENREAHADHQHVAHEDVVTEGKAKQSELPIEQQPSLASPSISKSLVHSDTIRLALLHYDEAVKGARRTLEKALSIR